MIGSTEDRRRRRRRFAAGLGLSAVAHVVIALFIARSDRPPSIFAPDRVEIEVRTAPAPPEPAVEPQPEPSARAEPRRRPTRSPAAPPTAAAPPPPVAPTDEGTIVTPASPPHPMMRMRAPGNGAPGIFPGEDTIARALGPMEAPPPDERPPPRPRRKPHVPGTGLTTLMPEQDRNVQQGAVHPRYFEVLSGSQSMFRPDRTRVADEVRGDLSASKSIKRWLFGGLAGDPEAMRNQIPHLGCLVCVTLRPSTRPEIEVAGASGAAWFDRAATESIEHALRRRPADDDGDLVPARACYHFASKVWRTRPDITNLSIPFKLNQKTTVQLISYEKLGG
jgi:hypothetical protein